MKSLSTSSGAYTAIYFTPHLLNMTHKVTVYDISLCGHQARWEPQRGPGNHYRGALTTSFRMHRDRDAEGVEKGGTVGGVSPHHPTRVLGEHRKLPQWGPEQMDFVHYLRSERHLEHSFQYFWALAGPPNVVGPGKTPPPTSLVGILKNIHARVTLSNVKCHPNFILPGGSFVVHSGNFPWDWKSFPVVD